MASIKLTGDTSGEITISAPAVAGTNTLTLPAETGSLLTDNISGDFTVDTSTFHVDSTNNRVGIGTTSPSHKLDIQGSSPTVRILENTAGTLTSSLKLHGNRTGTGGSVTSLEFINTEGASVGTETSVNSIQTWYESAGNQNMRFNLSGTERMRIDSSGNLKFNSGYGSAATAYAARAWVNFQGSGTVTIKASGNVSSIADNGTGRYTLNFATNMPDANYSIATTNSSLNDNLSYYVVGLRNQNPPDVKSTSQVRMQCGNGATGGATDSANISVTIFR